MNEYILGYFLIGTATLLLIGRYADREMHVDRLFPAAVIIFWLWPIVWIAMAWYVFDRRRI